MSNNIDKLADKLGKTYIGTPKSSAQRAAESAERKEGARIIAAERNAAEGEGSWMNAVKRATTAKPVVKKRSRRSLEGVTHSQRRVNPKSTKRNKKLQTLRLKAAHNIMKNIKKTKRRSKANAEIVASAMPNTRKMGRTRRETAAIKKTAIVENDEE